MNEHVSLMGEQYEFGSDKDGDFITFNGRISRNDSDALQPPSGELEEPEGKIKKIEAQNKNEPKPELSAKTSLVIKDGETSMTFKFE